jgi:hypothetical protein
MQLAPGARQPPFHLIAAMFTVQTPLAEVLTVVCQNPVAVLSEAGTRAVDHFPTIEAIRRTGPEPDSATAGETGERGLSHCSSAKSVCEPRVVHNLAAANIDSVMQISATWSDNV